MKKILNMIIFSLLISLPMQSMAQHCESKYFNLDFWMVGITKKGEALCAYRYCYYGCISKSYYVPGSYKPYSGPWKMDDGQHICEFSSNSCEFM